MGKYEPRPGDFKCVYSEDTSRATVHHYAGPDGGELTWRAVAYVAREDGEVMAHIFDTPEAGQAVGVTRRGRTLTSGQVGARSRFFAVLSKAALTIRNEQARPRSPKPIYARGGPTEAPTVTLDATDSLVSISAAA